MADRVTMNRVDVGRQGQAQSVPGFSSGFNSGASQALGNIARVVEGQIQLDQANRRTAESIKASETLSTAELQANEALSALDPLADDYDDQVSTIIEEQVNSRFAGLGLQDEEIRARANSSARILAQKAKVGATAARTAALERQLVSKYEDFATLALNQIEEDPAAYDDALARLSSQSGILLSSLPTEVREQAAENFADAAVIARANGMARAGDTDGALKFLDDAGDGVDPNKLYAARNQIYGERNRQKSERLRATQRQVANLEIGIIDGKISRDDIAAADRNGLYEGREEQRVQHIRMVEARDKATRAAETVTQDYLGQIAAGGNDGWTQSNVNEAYQALAEDAIASGEPVTIAQVATEFISMTGRVPTPVRNRVKTAETSSDPNRLAEAAQLVQSVQALRPGVSIGQGDRIETILSIARTEGVGISGAAIQVANSTRSPEEIEGAKVVVEAQLKNARFTPAESLAEEFGVDVGSLPAALVADFDSMVRRRMATLSVTPDAAISSAAESLKKQYGNSQIGGVTRVQKYSPESMLPTLGAVNLDAPARRKLIEGEVLGKLKELGITPGIIPGFEGRDGEEVIDTSGYPPFTLETDKQTAAEIAAGKPPSYEVRVRTSWGGASGIYMPAPLEGGGTLRYILPTRDQMMADPKIQELVKESTKRAGSIGIPGTSWRIGSVMPENIPFIGGLFE